ncbi:MAG: ABC transporter ATP-binding protein [Deferribacteraceae bacterium]|jgi:zinc transport system ATP-binding protein|nr:ABC transporter ATP-binding protein [Deferribacteraceae bacterium]
MVKQYLMNAIEISDLTFRHKSVGLPTLADVNLQVSEGAFLVIIGPNGGGKSTLIKLMLGLLPIQQGSISIFGQRLESQRRLVGYVPQDSDQIKNFPVNVMDTTLMSLQAYDKHEREARALRYLDMLDMAAFKDKRLNELSTGQRQRVLMARALAAEPKLLILDEPTSGIDPAGQQIILDVLKGISATIVFISHDLSVIPGYATAVACVNKGLHYHPSGEITSALMTQAYGNIPALSLVCHDCQHGHEV